MRKFLAALVAFMLPASVAADGMRLQVGATVLNRCSASPAVAPVRLRCATTAPVARVLYLRSAGRTIVTILL